MIAMDIAERVYENDTAENLYKFLMERLRMLDDYYM